MGFEIHRIGGVETAAALISDRDLHLAADGKTILEASDPKSATVLVGAGGTIPGPEVARLGLELVDGKIVQRGSEPAKTAETKQLDKPEDKQRSPAENKGAKGGK